jgi:hypothetical protein
LRHGRAVTVLTACAVGLVVAGAAWALQVAGLPRPDPGGLAAAKAMGWLTRDRLVESTFTLGNAAPVRSRCSRVELHTRGDVQPAARLEIRGGGVQTVPFGPSTHGQVAPRPHGLTLARLQLAGCPPVLAGMIAGVVKYSARTPFQHARVNGKPVLALIVGTKTGRLTVYLDAASKRPLAVTLRGARFSGRARLTPVVSGGAGA